MKFFVATCLALVAASGCTGTIDPGSASGDDQGDSEDPVIDPDEVLESKVCQNINPGTAPMRRLSNAEYRNTLVDLLGMSAQVATITADFTPENESLGFR